MLTYSIDELVALFRQKGYKVTPQRRAILELLRGDASHPAAEGIYQRLLPSMPDISRTTVYNTLHELVELGVLAPVEALSENGLRYDTNLQDHHHLYCMRCGALVDIAGKLGDLQILPEQAAGYQIVRQQITFYGYCPQCQLEMNM
jgi:Fur family peroxide stress response transcriptional regulator